MRPPSTDIFAGPLWRFILKDLLKKRGPAILRGRQRDRQQQRQRQQQRRERTIFEDLLRNRPPPSEVPEVVPDTSPRPARVPAPIYQPVPQIPEPQLEIPTPQQGAVVIEPGIALPPMPAGVPSPVAVPGTVRIPGPSRAPAPARTRSPWPLIAGSLASLLGRSAQGQRLAIFDGFPSAPEAFPGQPGPGVSPGGSPLELPGAPTTASLTGFEAAPLQSRQGQDRKPCKKPAKKRANPSNVVATVKPFKRRMSRNSLKNLK